MSFNTYSEGLNIATSTANRAIAAESSLQSLSHHTSPLPTLIKAFHLYVKAADAYSHLLSSNLVAPTDRPVVQRKCKLVLDRADKVKHRVEKLGGRVGMAEMDDDAEEAAVVRRGGRMNGVTADVWRSDPSEHEFTIGRHSNVFRAARQPPLDPEQLKLDPEWAAVEEEEWGDPNAPSSSSQAWQVRQGTGADCSVTAGLGTCFAHNARWGTKLGQSCLYPQTVSGQPRYSENAKHIVKLLLNGTWRSVVIDSLLPRSKSTHAPLHITATRGSVATQGSIGPPWLPLAVKGYFSTLGGYSIPGSNPAPDVYAFTGWIPEHLYFNSEVQREKEWDRLLQAWRTGQVLVNLGSGRASSTGLVPLHAYGVIDIREDDDGQRVLRIFDPGSSHPGDVASLMAQLQLNTPSSEVGFLMTWDEVCTKFERLNLNWNPDLFPVTATRHWSWAAPSDADAVEHSLVLLNTSPRYRISVRTQAPDSELWLLLSQHEISCDQPLDDVALHVFRDHRLRNNGDQRRRRMSMSTRENTHYTNVQHSLVRFPLRQGENILDAVASRDRGSVQRGFTLRAFAPAGTDLTLTRVSLSLPFQESVTDALTKRSAGGHPGHPLHYTNPQYRLTVSSATPGTVGKSLLRLTLRGSSDVAWNVNLVWGKGQRVFEMDPDIVIVSSGPYTYGTAYAEAHDVLPGEYTVVVSGFEPGQLGDYTLSVESSAPVRISPIPQEGAGMFARAMQGRWDANTAGGRPSSNTYDRNPHVEVILPVSATVMARLFLPTPAPVPINLTFFRRAARTSSNGDGSEPYAARLGEQVVTSGKYIDEVSGVACARTRLPAGVYIAVPSTYQPGLQLDWVLHVWADTAFSLG